MSDLGLNSSTFYACNFTPVLLGGIRKKICDTTLVIPWSTVLLSRNNLYLFSVKKNLKKVNFFFKLHLLGNIQIYNQKNESF